MERFYDIGKREDIGEVEISTVDEFGKLPAAMVTGWYKVGGTLVRHLTSLYLARDSGLQ